MGADGSIVIVSRAAWDEANPDVPPKWLGLYTGTVLGVDACWGYFGDNLYSPNYLTRYTDDYGFSSAERIWTGTDYRPATAGETEAIWAAVDWFEGNAEAHKVWT